MERSVKLRRQVTDYNVSRLGLISIQARLPAEHHMGWQAVRTDGTNRQGIICSTTDPSGVPHGLASDVFSGLLTEAAIRAEGGVGSGTEIVTTAAGIAKNANLKVHARHYPVIDQALSALASTKYKVFAQWTDPMTRSSRDATFSILDYLEKQEEEHIFNRSQAQRNYIIRLNQEIARSIEGSLVLAINPTILESLPSPGARAIYRMLESLRRDPEEVTRAAGTLTLSIAELAETTRLLTPRQEAGHQVRLLNSPFKALVDTGYLHGYETIGRGGQTQIHFRFADDGSLLNTEARRLLLEAGVTGKNAESLAIGHTREEIECAIWVVDDKKRRDQTIRNPAGLIVKTLKDGTARDMLSQYRQRRRVVAVQPRQSATPGTSTPAKEAASPSQATKGVLQSLLKQGKITGAQLELLNKLADEGRIGLQEVNSLITSSASGTQNIVEGLLTRQ